jgi:hypothetical protein
MPKFKRVVEVAFLTIISIALLAQAATIFFRWRHGKEVDREILNSCRVEVVKVNPHFPPGLLIAYTNSGRLPVAKTRFLLAIDRDALEIARIERDYGELKPGKTESVLLQSVAPLGASPAVAPGTVLTYRLLVFPNNKKPLPEISGRLEIR